jgi:hypothetical protein
MEARPKRTRAPSEKGLAKAEADAVAAEIPKRGGGRPKGSPNTVIRKGVPKGLGVGLSIGERDTKRSPLGRNPRQARSNFGEHALSQRDIDVLDAIEHGEAFFEIFRGQLMKSAPAVKQDLMRRLMDLIEDDDDMTTTSAPSPTWSTTSVQALPVARVSSSTLLATNTKNSQRQLEKRNKLIALLTMDDLAGQFRYAAMKDTRIVRVVAQHLSPELVDTIGGIFTEPMCYAEALELKFETHLSDKDYTTLRRMLPEGLLPSVFPVKKAQHSRSEVTHPLPGIEDSVFVTDVLGMIKKDMPHVSSCRRRLSL